MPNNTTEKHSRGLIFQRPPCASRKFYLRPPCTPCCSTEIYSIYSSIYTVETPKMTSQVLASVPKPCGGNDLSRKKLSEDYGCCSQ